MSVFVLVHGAWHGSWCWKRVRRSLQSHGHDVFTPTLTGIAERSHLLTPQVDLETRINDVANLILWEELDDVVLCGHSYGGCVISGVADRVSDRIGALVYLDAFILEDGQGLFDTIPTEVREEQLELTRNSGEGWKVPPPPAEFFNVNAKDREWVNRQCTAQSLATFQERIRLTGAVDRIRNVTFIQAMGWSSSPFSPFCDLARARGWKTVTIACGHDVMLDAPEELTAQLLAVPSQKVASGS
jgi:pimeloyl-ACP methyl ester carboxylesterase